MEFTSCKLGWEECGGGAGAAENNIIIIIISHLIEFYSYDIYHIEPGLDKITFLVEIRSSPQLGIGSTIGTSVTLFRDVIGIIIINNNNVILLLSGCLDRCRHKITWKYHFLMFNDLERSFLVHDRHKPAKMNNSSFWHGHRESLTAVTEKRNFCK